MKSEKEKEIRIALCQKRDLFYIINGQLKVVTNEDILTLINELERVNERLLEQNGALSCDLEIISEKLTNAEIEVDDYKDRIAELEKENAKLLDSVETVQNNRCTTKCELTEKQLKQFAERLKEMAYKSTDWSHGEHPMVVEVDYIDETLKEFIDKNL